MASGWIFQGNPTKFPVDAYLARSRDIKWLAKPDHLARGVLPGDAAFIWRADGGSKGTGGIVAIGTVTDSPTVQADDADELWLTKMAPAVTMRACIHIEEIRLHSVNGMLLRTDLQEHPFLKNLWILKWRSQTLYPLNAGETAELLKLWKATA